MVGFMKHSPIEQRLLAEHGDQLGAFLRELYVERRLSYREMMPILGTTYVPRIRALLEKYGIPVRRGSEAVATQWEKNPERRAKASRELTKRLREQAARGEHWAKGYTKETHPGIARTAGKLARRRWLLRPEVVQRAHAHRRANHRADPSTHIQATAQPTRAERIFAEHLQATGRAFEFQHPIVVGDELYFIDFFLPDANLAIELTKIRSRVPAERLRAIWRAGHLPLAIPNYPVERGQFAHIDQAIAGAYAGEFHPATVGECWVTRSPGQLSAGHRAELDQPLG